MVARRWNIPRAIVGKIRPKHGSASDEESALETEDRVWVVAGSGNERAIDSGEARHLEDNRAVALWAGVDLAGGVVDEVGRASANAFVEAGDDHAGERRSVNAD